MRAMQSKPATSPAKSARPPRSRAGSSKQQLSVATVAIIAVILIALIGAGAWLLLRGEAARPSAVTIQIEPAPESVFINGERMLYPEAGAFELPAGDHLLEVAVPGYALLEVPFSVEAARPNAYEFALDVLPGVLSVRANTPSEIRIDDAVIGTTPLDGVELEPGSYTLSADGGGDFQPHEETLEIKGYRERQAVEIELVRSWSWVSVTSVPPGARVLDERDQLVGLAGQPIKVHAREAPYEWTLSGGPAFEPVALSFNVEADKDLDLGQFEIDLKHASIKVESLPHGLTIAVNGRVTEHKTPHIFSVPPGRDYTIGLRSADYEKVAKTLTPEPGRNYEVKLEPVAKTGRVHIESVPRGVKVFHGQELLGLTPLELERDAGEHSFIFQRLGYLDSDAKVTVRPDRETELNITMKRAQ